MRPTSRTRICSQRGGKEVDEENDENDQEDAEEADPCCVLL